MTFTANHIAETNARRQQYEREAARQNAARQAHRASKEKPKRRQPTLEQWKQIISRLG
jgi:hypothetical protein